jgi:hypothetical protein
MSRPKAINPSCLVNELAKTWHARRRASDFRRSRRWSGLGSPKQAFACELPHILTHVFRASVPSAVGGDMAGGDDDPTPDDGESVELSCRLVAAFENVKDEDTRGALLALVESMAGIGQQAKWSNWNCADRGFNSTIFDQLRRNPMPLISRRPRASLRVRSPRRSRGRR